MSLMELITPTSASFDAFLTSTYSIVPTPRSRPAHQSHRSFATNTLAAPDQLSISDAKVFEKLLRHTLRDSRIRLEYVARVDSTLHRIWQLTEQDRDRQYILKCPPSRHTKVLRCERHRIESEGLVLDFLKRASTNFPTPITIDQDQNGCNPLDQPYILRSYIGGIPWSKLQHGSSPQSPMNIALERCLGSHLRTITSITQSRFGFAHRVLAGVGAKTWPEAFVAMMEAVLRDGEDHLVSLPYDSIRYWISASVDVLKDVKEARLVPLGLEDRENILVDPRTMSSIRCLLGWGDVVFGDPFLSTIFNNRARSFWEGFGDSDVVPGGPHEGREVL